jgi:flavin-binding protein dodecin
MPSYKTYKGTSKKGVPEAIEKAIQKAVAEYEKDWGIPPKPVRLRVVDIHVTVTNPVRDYVVTLGPGG